METTIAAVQHHEDDQDDDALSLCDLPINDQDHPNFTSPRTSSAQLDPFEFFPEDSDSTCPSCSSPHDIVFCGKVIHDENDEQLNEYQKRDYLDLTRPDPNSHEIDHDRERLVANNPRSGSVRFTGSDSNHFKCSNCSKVNITALTSMSAKSKRRMFMFGPVKFKPEMELSAIRERQSRHVPGPMFLPEPAAVGGGDAATAGGDGAGGKGMVKTMKGRAHLTTMLARSLGCIPLT